MQHIIGNFNQSPPFWRILSPINDSSYSCKFSLWWLRDFKQSTQMIDFLRREYLIGECFNSGANPITKFQSWIFKILFFDWMLLVTWWNLTNQSSLFKSKYSTLKYVCEIVSSLSPDNELQAKTISIPRLNNKRRYYLGKANTKVSFSCCYSVQSCENVFFHVDLFSVPSLLKVLERKSLPFRFKNISYWTFSPLAYLPTYPPTYLRNYLSILNLFCFCSTVLRFNTSYSFSSI